MQHILTAIDGSEPAERALKFAVDLAKRLETKLTVLIVREYLVGRKDVIAILNEEEIAALKSKAEAIVGDAALENVDYLKPKSRDAALTIVDTATSQKADLIVMGASGKGAVKTMLIGSVSQDVLRKAPCPVTIVH